MKPCGLCNSFCFTPILRCPKCKVYFWCEACTQNPPQHAAAGFAAFHGRLCVADPNVKQALTFKVMDTVLCETWEHGLWEKCIVTEVWPLSMPDKVYKVQNCDNSKSTFIAHDTHDVIRPVQESRKKPQLLWMLKYGESLREIINFVNHHDLNWSVYGPLSLHYSASYGNFPVFIALVEQFDMNPSVVDSKGRNFIHLAIMGKMTAFLGRIPVNRHPAFGIEVFHALLTATDDDGRNVFHLCAIAGVDRVILVSTFSAVRQSSNLPQCALQHDIKGHTALEYAIMLKRTDLMDVFSAYAVFEMVQQCLNEIHVESNEHMTDDQAVVILEKYLTIKGLTVDNLGVNEESIDLFQEMINVFIDRNYLKCLTWLYDGDWKLLERTTTENGDYMRGFLANKILNTKKSIIPLDELEKLLQAGQSASAAYARIKSIMYDNCRSWNDDTGSPTAESLAAHLRRCAAEPSTILKYDPTLSKLFRTKEACLSILCTYLQRYADWLCGTGYVAARLTMLQYLGQMKRQLKNLSLLWFVSNPDCLMLQWFVKEFKIDLNAPLVSDPVFCNFIIEHKAYNSLLGGANRTLLRMALREVLSVMAIIGDNLHSFEWLQLDENHTAQKQKHIKQRRLNKTYLFHTALLTRCYMVTKWCALSNYCTKKDLNTLRLKHLFKDSVGQYSLEIVVSLLGNSCIASRLKDYYGKTISPAISYEWKMAAARIQSLIRMALVRTKYGHCLTSDYRQFKAVWRPALKLLRQASTKRLTQAPSWSVVKAQYHMVTVNIDDISELLTSAAVMSVGKEDSATAVTVDTTHLQPYSIATVAVAQQRAPVNQIELSSHTLKWFEGADNRHRDMFQKRMVQLADGDRSYALSKRLQHCRYPMWETKLDPGQRILWTTVKRGTVTSLLIWCVSKHDGVPRQIQRINDACQRLAKEPVLSVEGDGCCSEPALHLEDDDVLTDPTGNAPLKVYSTNRTELASAVLPAGWKPPLRLSGKQKQANEESGTVLLLGRSGTGKTICLCDRMTRDRSRHVGLLKQLFVCRSKRLCEFVQAYQTQYCDSDALEGMAFLTLSQFTSQVASHITADHGESTAVLTQANRVDYNRFVSVLLPTIVRKCSVAPSVLWLQIRSFIKGSVEAVVQQGPISLQQYTDLSVFGLDRCRLSVENRKEVYGVFARYQDELKAQDLWDDADYTLDLLNRSKLEPLRTSYDKVYVDEVQDNTQAEIVLYFLAAGMNTQALFLAGDPAQSVVEGVDFRFEDVRSIVYKLSDGKQSISRSMKLFVNYRSHSGILNCAAAVLDKMFAAFPAAAKVLPKDAGLFKGPRPACCQVDGMEGLVPLLQRNERLIVLCDDSAVESVESQLATLSVRNLVLGIRASKGLEFQDVVLLDFFACIPKQDQSVWKSLFTVESGGGGGSCAAHPHIELQLKLLYTAVTRSCNRLLFVETSQCQLSSVMFRWLTTGSGLAETYTPSSQESHLMTSDEWRVQGIEFALSAEGDSTVMFLEKAVKCFTLANDSALCSRAAAELAVARMCKRLSAQSGVVSEGQERELAQVVASGLSQGLVAEVKGMCEVVCERVKFPSLFQKEIGRFLQ